MERISTKWEESGKSGFIQDDAALATIIKNGFCDLLCLNYKVNTKLFFNMRKVIPTYWIIAISRDLSIPRKFKVSGSFLFLE
jgi:hypothetical protein